MGVEWGARTDVGNRRARNEDSYLAAPPMFAVADGMGGHEGGELASALAVAAMGELGPEPTMQAVQEVVGRANDAIRNAEITRPGDGRDGNHSRRDGGHRGGRAAVLARLQRR